MTWFSTIIALNTWFSSTWDIEILHRRQWTMMNGLWWMARWKGSIISDMMSLLREECWGFNLSMLTTKMLHFPLLFFLKNHATGLTYRGQWIKHENITSHHLVALIQSHQKLYKLLSLNYLHGRTSKFTGTWGNQHNVFIPKLFTFSKVCRNRKIALR